MATPLTIGIPPLIDGQKVEEWEPLFRAAVGSLVASANEKAAVQLLPAYLSRREAERSLALEAIKRDTLDEAFKLLKDNLDPPDDVYEATRKYYAMEWSSGELVDDFWVRLVREAKRAKHSSLQASISLITQLPAEIQSSCKSWIADKGEELSAQSARDFIVKVRSLTSGGKRHSVRPWLDENGSFTGHQCDKRRKTGVDGTGRFDRGRRR